MTARLEACGPDEVVESGLALSVVVCAFTARRWEDLCRAAESVLSQNHPVQELVVVIDHADELYVRTTERFASVERVTVCRNNGARGLSGARNTGVGLARGDVIAFLDDDAWADPHWAGNLLRHYQDERVAGVGGHAEPVWPDRRPGWMPPEFDWVVGCSYVGQLKVLGNVRNPIGCNLSIRRSVFAAVGGFSPKIGRIGSVPAGCEETELCIRIGRSGTCSRILLDPDVRVRHRVTGERVTVRYFLRRCHHEGRSKAVVAELTASSDALTVERAYVRDVLPRAILRELSSRSVEGLERTAMISLGLAATAAGYLDGVVRRSRRARTR